MTRVLFFLFAFLQISFAQAQSFSISPNPAYGDADLDANPFTIEIVAEAFISNNTDEVLNLKWERIVNDKPECWFTAVSDPWLSSLPNSDSHKFEVAANSDNNSLYVTAFVNDLTGMNPAAGEAHVIVKVSNLDLPSDSVIVDFFITATGAEPCGTVGISEKEKNALNLYPNPSSDFIQLSENSLVNRLVIYNILGSPVLTFNTSANQKHDISGLPKGVYLLEMMNSNGNRIKTVKLLKD